MAVINIKDGPSIKVDKDAFIFCELYYSNLLGDIEEISEVLKLDFFLVLYQIHVRFIEAHFSNETGRF
jgi:hypothetical protein